MINAIIGRGAVTAPPVHFPNVQLDTFVVMPNHVHGIICLTAIPAVVGARLPRPYTLGQIVAYFKYQSTKSINLMRGTPGVTVWQRNYYEHTIRDEESLHRIRQYILNNPARWVFDQENPAATTPEPENVWHG